MNLNNFIKKLLNLVLFSIPAVAIYVPQDMYFPFITGKNFLFRFLVEFSLALYICLVIINKSYKPRWNILLKSFLAFTFVMLLADIFAINPHRALWSNFERMDGFVTIVHLFIYLIILSGVFRESKDWVIMLYSTLAVSIFMTLFSFLQLFGGAVINQGGVRLDGTLGNSAYLAVYILFHIFISIFLFITPKKDSLKYLGNSVTVGSLLFVFYYLYGLSLEGGLVFTNTGFILIGISLILIFKILLFRYYKNLSNLSNLFYKSLFSFIILSEMIVLYYTATRGAIIGFLGGIIVSSVILCILERKNKLLKKVSLSILATLFVLILGFYVLRNTEFIQNSPVLNRFANISLSENKTQARGYIWPMAIQAWKENPILGWGQDNFIYAFSKYYVPDMVNHEPWFDRAHNAFLDWLFSGGIFALIGWIMIYISSIFLTLKSERFDSIQKSIIIGLIFAYLFQSMFIFDNLVSYMLFVLVLGLVMYGSGSDKQNEKYIENKLEPIVLVIVFVIFVISSLYINYKPYKQNKTLALGLMRHEEGVSKNLELLTAAVRESKVGEFESVEQMHRVVTSALMSNTINPGQKTIFANRLYEELNRIVLTYPYDVRAYIMLGTFLSDVGLNNEAIQILNKALAISPNKQQIHHLIARSYFAIGVKDEDYVSLALDSLKNAYDLSPQYDSEKNVYATGLIISGQYKKALEIIGGMNSLGEIFQSDLLKIVARGGFIADIESIANKAIKNEPENLNIYKNMVSISESINDNSRARVWKDKLIAVNPESNN